MTFSKEEQPIIIQLFGHDTECLKISTEYINNNLNPIAIDINMGCPAPKIFQNGDGCALMKDSDLAYKVICSVKQNTNLPVSVKFRSGIDENNINAVEFAKMCESAGADFITVHARTREQFYNGLADRDIIKNVVQNVSIPVIANGDITSGESARSMLDHTGAHSLMIGRAALGNPIIFNQIKNDICNNFELKKEPLFEVALEQLKLVMETKPQHIAVKEFRKHLLWYFKGIKNAAEYKRKASTVISFDDCKKLLEKAKIDLYNKKHNLIAY